MKTRILHTRFWKDSFISELAPLEKLVFIYLLTNEYVNIIHLYECSDKQIRFDTGIDTPILERAKQKFEEAGKIYFKDGYVYLRNSDKYETFSGGKNDKARENLLNQLNPTISQWYTEIQNTPIHTQPIGTINHKSEIISHKSEIIKQKTKEEIESDQVIEIYNSLFEKRKTVSTSWFDNFIKWRKAYSLEDILEAIVNWHDGGWLWKYKDGEPDLTMLFRTSNKAGSCDYIGQLLNRKVSNSKRPLGEDEYINAMGERKKKDV